MEGTDETMEVDPEKLEKGEDVIGIVLAVREETLEQLRTFCPILEVLGQREGWVGGGNWRNGGTNDSKR